jgi:ArsR family transcriptional regulator
MEDKGIKSKKEILKALTQPTRMKILECLRKGERNIHKIVPAIHGEQSNISRHISLMQKNHIVTTRKDGVRVMVKVKDTEIFNILDRVSKILKGRFKK